jgi:hypothetical protein
MEKLHIAEALTAGAGIAGLYNGNQRPSTSATCLYKATVGCTSADQSKGECGGVLVEW